MKLKKTVTIGDVDNKEKGIDQTRNMSGDERVSLLEDLRRNISLVTKDEYPRRLRRILTIVKGA